MTDQNLPLLGQMVRFGGKKILVYKGELMLSPDWEPWGTHEVDENERDIELIPAGTRVWDIRIHSCDVCRCSGVIKDKIRSLLIFNDNLSPILG